MSRMVLKEALRSGDSVIVIGNDVGERREFILSVAKQMAVIESPTTSEVLGFWSAEGGKLQWNDGSLTEAVRYGDVAVVEGLPDISLLSKLDSLITPYEPKSFVLAEKHNEVVPIHSDFRLVLSMDEEQLKKINPAFANAFWIIRLGE